MRVGKQRAAGGQTINMGRLHLRMTFQAADPVVLIVDGDEQDIGLLRRQRRHGNQQPAKHKQRQHQCSPKITEGMGA